jgi:hypothetical protein
MPTLPKMDFEKQISDAPHVVIIGAGASLAACPGGDKNGNKLPLMNDLIDVVGLRPILRDYGINDAIPDFESFYDDLVSNTQDPGLRAQIEDRVREYFSSLQLPNEATLYDLLVLSLRGKDLIASFNWDPFLVQAYCRNSGTGELPEITFLHGNVEIGICRKDGIRGRLGNKCRVCQELLEPSRLLFPVKQKDYNADEYIRGEWERLRDFLKRAYYVTIFGYSAPKTDIEARSLMLEVWRENPTRELAQVDIVDIRPRKELEENWQDFFVRSHYGIQGSISHSWLFRYVRRSCEAFAMATLQSAPWKRNPFPKTKSLAELQNWICPLLLEEENQSFSGNPCPRVSG